MTAKDYLLSIGFDDAHLPELFNDSDKSYYQVTELMESYHQSKVENLSIHSVSVREFECDDVVCTNDGRMWVITEIDGEDVYVTGNGKRDYPLEKSEITHAH